MTKNKKHLAEQYAKDVIEGKVKVGGYIYKAVQRYYNDLKREDIYFDRAWAKKCLDFIGFLKQWKGKFAGKELSLSPHQQFFFWNIFGFKRLDGSRRFRKAYYTVARKNGKTTMLSAAGIIHLTLDGEEGPQIYAGATKEAQSRIVVNDAGKIIKKTDELKKMLKTFDNGGDVRRVVNYNNNGVIVPLGRDSDTQDGFDPYIGIIDEYHAHPDNGIRNVIESGMGAREQPLIYFITTAGFNRHSVCYEFEQTCQKMLDGIIEYDDLFAMVFKMDEGDDWKDESVWPKSNPNLGYSINYDYLRDRKQAAENEGSGTEVDVLTKNFNVWTDSAETWIQHETWANLERNYSDEDLMGVPCWGGLDLSSTNDLTAFSLLFDLNDHLFLKYWFFTPKDRPHKKDDVGVDYDKWVRDGYLLANEGNVIDYDFVKSVIEKQCEKFEVNSIGFDPYNAPQIVPKMADEGIALNKFAQGITTMSHPTKDFERRVMQGTISHETNPCMDWQMSNVEIYRDANENIKVTKKNAHKSRVDGVVASIMALGEMITNSEGDEDSVYNERGIITV